MMFSRLIRGLGALLGFLALAPRAQGADPMLNDLRSVDELRTLFNQDAGVPRFVLLLSPT